uniref:FERM domain containing 4A n=1 Tax=Lates calcarifer TaxID=8187 RepID=A0A4W6DLQ4_LATCA
MTEGRRCQVHLLDDRKLELLVQPKLMAKDLLDLVASHFNLKEKEYFGIAYTDETGHFSWLQLDRRVLEHEFPKKSGPIVLYFCVRFYIESISYLKDNATIELFFLNAKSIIYKELIEVDSEVVFELASYILQVRYSVNDATRSDLKKLPALPTQALKEHPSLAYCEDRVIEHYKKLSGQSRGQAIVNYMSIVESLPTYGVHYYAVKDKQGIPWWLGLSYKGIFQYDHQDKVKPRKVFQWRQLENLYFREKKFSVEVHDPRRASVTRRTFGHSGIAVHTWYACPALIKSIWAMAISQHQFYLDRKQSKSKIHAARSLSEIAIDLTETGTLKTSKLANMGSKGKIISGSSGSLLSSGSQESDSSQTAKKDMLAALRARQEALEETLRQRLEELKSICIREAELTGKRKIGTAFKLDEQKILPKGEEEELERLEREFAIQSQITEAARRLASDPHVSSKKLKKQRKTSYLNALKKLQEIENSINEYRVRSGKKPTQRASLIIEGTNILLFTTGLFSFYFSVLDDPQVTGTPTFSPVASPHKGLPPRPPSHSRPPPPQSLDGLRHLHYTRSDYDKSPIKPKMWSESSLDEPYEKVKKRSSHSSHRRFPSSGSAEAGGSNSLQSSPIRSLPHWNSQSSMPSTPDLRSRTPHYVHSTRSVDISPTRLHSLAQHFRNRSSSLESQGKLLASDPDAHPHTLGTLGSPDFFLGPGRSSNGSDPLDDCSSCTSQSSSEHYYPSGGPPSSNPNYSTLGEDSPSKARQRQRQRHRSAGHLGSSNSGSMPNLAAKNGSGGGSGGGGVGGGHHGVYLHSQSQPSSQYRIKEYPLYVEGSPNPVVVRSLESDQEGHYSVKAQFKTSSSYTAGGLYKEAWGGEEGGEGSGRLTPSRSQIVRTPSLGREGGGGGGGGGGRAAVSEELRCWYQRSSGSLKERSHSHSGSTSSETGSHMTNCQFSPIAASPHSQRSMTPSSEHAATPTPPCSPQHILNWQSGGTADSSPTEDVCQSPPQPSSDA